jgi:hypothetical protein
MTDEGMWNMSGMVVEREHFRLFGTSFSVALSTVVK